MKYTTQQPFKRNWTGPIVKSGKFHSAKMGLYVVLSRPWGETHNFNFLLYVVFVFCHACTDPEGWGGKGSNPQPHPLKNYKNIELLSNTGPDLLKNHKAIKPAFKARP